MNDNAFHSICALLSSGGANFTVLTHPPCRTSAESAAARTAAGAPTAVGAKAILCKLYFREKEEFAVFVMPGTHRMDAPAVKSALPGLRKLRFASSDEMLALCGVLPGCMPPFGPQVFPEVGHLYIDTAIEQQDLLGFNAANFCRSLVVPAADYMKAVANKATVLRLSTPGESDAHAA